MGDSTKKTLCCGTSLTWTGTTRAVQMQGERQERAARQHQLDLPVNYRAAEQQRKWRRSDALSEQHFISGCRLHDPQHCNSTETASVRSSGLLPHLAAVLTGRT